MTSRVELHLTGSLDHLRIAWQTGETLLATVPFHEDPAGTRYNTLLAIQEMLTNVLRHAHRLDASKTVRIVMEADPTGLAIEIWDQGYEFDPTEYEPAAHTLGDEMPTVGGGFGIVITRTVMDSMEHRREGGWNVVTLRKCVAPLTASARTED